MGLHRAIMVRYQTRCQTEFGFGLQTAQAISSPRGCWFHSRNPVLARDADKSSESRFVGSEFQQIANSGDKNPLFRVLFGVDLPFHRASERDIIQILPVVSTSAMPIRPPAADQPPC